VITYEEYHPFGSTAFHTAAGAAEVSAKRYRYTGKEKDEETGLYYYGARYYAPWLCRWTAADPAGMIDGTNLYPYVRNCPVNVIDPFGLDGVDVDEEETDVRVGGGVKPVDVALAEAAGMGNAVIGAVHGILEFAAGAAFGGGSSERRENAEPFFPAPHIPTPEGETPAQTEVLKEVGQVTEEGTALVLTVALAFAGVFTEAPAAAGAAEAGATEAEASTLGNIAKAAEGAVKEVPKPEPLPSPGPTPRTATPTAPTAEVPAPTTASTPNATPTTPTPGGAAAGSVGRAGALNQAKRDLGLPRAQHPESVLRVPLTRADGTRVLGADGKPIMTRVYTYKRPDGSTIVIQEHSAGHQFGEGGVGDQGSHLNVRPPDDLRHGTVLGTQPHYPFNR
jgi:RHS repeat-associated protein